MPSGLRFLTVWVSPLTGFDRRFVCGTYARGTKNPVSSLIPRCQTQYSYQKPGCWRKSYSSALTRLDGVRFDRAYDRGYYLRLWDEIAHFQAPEQLPTTVTRR